MQTLDFGLVLPTLDQIPETAQRLEELGFSYVACGEHVMFHRAAGNAFVALGAAAAVTTRINLLSSVTLLPLYPPVLAAKLTSVLDVVSGGRFNLGVGVGGEFPREFEACGVPVGERGRRTDEALEVIDRLLRGANVSFEGRFFRFTDVTLTPAPLRKPRPPFWIAGRKAAAMRRAGRFGDFWMPYMYTPDQLASSLATVRQHARDAGREATAVRGSLYAFATVYPDGEQARRVAAEVVGQSYRQDFRPLVDRYLIAGTPAQCRERLRQYRDAGAEVAVLSLAAPREDQPAMLRALAEEVMPDLR